MLAEIDARRYRTQLMVCAVALLLWLPACAETDEPLAAQPPPPHPNVLFVFSDSHRARSLGCYGDEQIATPHLDALAADGLLLRTAISNTPLCKPYRATLMTGLLAPHTGILANDSEHNFYVDEQRDWAPPTAVTLAGSFADAGYRCGYVGKWHLSDPALDPGPERLGFNDGWVAADRPVHVYDSWAYHLSATETFAGEGGFRPAIETDHALQFMAEDDERPWFLMLSWGPPHEPFEAPAGFDQHPDVIAPANVPGRKAGRHGGTSLPQYYGLIEALDAQFGRLMASLEQAGMADNTLVVYTSDHGTMIGSQGRMGKEVPYSESSNVPFLMRWPGQLGPDSTLAMPFGTADIFPTLAGLCSVPVPDGLDGSDFSRLLLGDSRASPQEAVYMASYDGRAEGWPGWRGVRTERYVYAAQPDGPWLLFDCADDPDQLHNLVDDEPELVKQLHELTMTLMARHGDTWDPGPP